MGAYSGFIYPKWTSFSSTWGRPVTAYEDTTFAEGYAETQWYIGLYPPPLPPSFTGEIIEGATANASVRTDIPTLPVDYQIASSIVSASLFIPASISEGVSVSDAVNKTWVDINSPSTPSWGTIDASSAGSSWTEINTPSTPAWTIIQTP
jgi:hypothetical protein